MVENFDQIIMFSIFGIGINATIFFSWIVILILMLLSILATRNLKKEADRKISRLQTAMEVIVKMIYDQIKEASNDNPMKFIPMVGTFFMFILASNVLSIIPWFKPPTASFSTTLAFATCVFIAMPVYGMSNVGFMKYFKKYIEPSPVLLPFNLIGDLSSVLSLAVRLYGNILSGCVIGAILISLVPYLLPLPLQMLGLLTGTIQAYIFAVLAIVYVSSVGPSENKDKKEETQKIISKDKEGEKQNG